MEQIFIGSSRVRPSERWSKAFPQGEVIDQEQFPCTPARGVLLWVDSALDNWEQLVAGLRQSEAAGVVVLSASPAEEQALQALSLGARAYCHSYSPVEMLLEVAVVVARGGLWVGPRLLERLIGAMQRHRLPAASAPASAALEQLSPREREVALRVAEGHSNKQIAAQLDISERTVKSHLGTIFTKLDVSSRLQLALLLTPGKA